MSTTVDSSVAEDRPVAGGSEAAQDAAAWQARIAAALDPARPVLLAGATASGKSALALAIARAHGGSVVNADALQVYRDWRILTARPSPEDEARAPHLLYGHVGFRTPWSVGDWLRALAPILAEHRQDGRPLVIVGGTGLYFTALTEGLAEIPPISPRTRARAEAIVAAEGHEALVADLARRDPRTHERIDLANPVRVQRAWEVLAETGRGLAAWQDETPPPLLPAEMAQPFVLSLPPPVLAERIERRFDAMMAAGALEEVRALRPVWDPHLPAAKAIGARELMAHLEGRLSLDEAVAAAKRATRDYARRQRKWFRRKMAGWPRLTPPSPVCAGEATRSAEDC